MTTQATSSNNALGRRSLTSSFFAPLQSIGLYRDRTRKDDDREAGIPPGLSPSLPPDLLLSLEVQAKAQDQTEAGTLAAGLHPGLNAEAGLDATALRGTISRLAREVRMQWAAADAPDPREADMPKVKALEADSTKAAEAGTAAFAEVARRVWSQEAEMTEEAAACARDFAEEFAWKTWSVSGGPRSAEGPVQPELTIVPPAAAAGASSGSLPVAMPERMVKGRAGLEAKLTTTLEASTELSLAAREGARRGERQEEAHALAHDASNLLSALRLYSELLCFSGVLHERHRHYAEDLKLLSLRSERLMGRLFLLAEQVAAADRTGETFVLSDQLGMGVRPGDPAVRSFGRENLVAEEPRAKTLLPVDLCRESPGSSFAISQEHAGPPEQASLAGTLMRLRGVLGTIARGTLELDMGPDAGLPIAAPAEAIERVLVNLVTNAASAVREGGAIRIRAGVSAADPDAPPAVVLSVDDSGRGMTEAQVDAALGRHAASGSVDDSVASRHGLGLSIVRELVRFHGGQMALQSRPGKGTRVEIHWRMADAALRAAGRPAAPLRKVAARWNAGAAGPDSRPGGTQHGHSLRAEGAVA